MHKIQVMKKPIAIQHSYVASAPYFSCLHYSVIMIVTCICLHCHFADSVPDSFGSDCAIDETVCCETNGDVTSFCIMQCNLPPPNNCVCVDQATGERIDGLFTFPEPLPNDPNPIDCLSNPPLEESDGKLTKSRAPMQEVS